MNGRGAVLREGSSSRPLRNRAVSATGRRYDAVVATPWAGLALGVRVRDDMLIAIDFLTAPAMQHTPRTGIAGETAGQLQAYFRDPRSRFNLPSAPAGTAFQYRVWAAMRRIPAGETRSYGELARQLGSSARAIGGACRANPIPVVIPCHRVVAAHGMGGFMGTTAGAGLRIKQHLLAHESAFRGGDDGSPRSR
ncbi:MAG: methylated-DNA--[protein]-cysteine S-methyltransferase [Gammaproteobacteria bacterium]